MSPPLRVLTPRVPAPRVPTPCVPVPRVSTRSPGLVPTVVFCERSVPWNRQSTTTSPGRVTGRHKLVYCTHDGKSLTTRELFTMVLHVIVPVPTPVEGPFSRLRVLGHRLKGRRVNTRVSVVVDPVVSIPQSLVGTRTTVPVVSLRFQCTVPSVVALEGLGTFLLGPICLQPLRLRCRCLLVVGPGMERHSGVPGTRRFRPSSPDPFRVEDGEHRSARYPT